MLNRQEQGIQTIKELGQETRQMRGEHGGRTGVVHSTETLDEYTFSRLTSDVKRVLRRGHRLSIDTEGAAQLTINPGKPIVKGEMRFINHQLDRINEEARTDELLTAWGIKQPDVELTSGVPSILSQTLDQASVQAAHDHANYRDGVNGVSSGELAEQRRAPAAD